MDLFEYLREVKGMWVEVLKIKRLKEEKLSYSENFYLLKKGCILLLFDNGMNTIVNTRNLILGYNSIIDKGVKIFKIFTLTDVELVKIDKKLLEKEVEKIEFLKLLSEHEQDFLSKQVMFHYSRSKRTRTEHLALTLYILGSEVLKNIDKMRLSKIVVCSRVTLDRALEELIDYDLIEVVNNKIHIISMNELHSYLEGLFPESIGKSLLSDFNL